MGKTALVERDLEEGARFLEALDAAGFDASAAFWLYSSEAGEWRYVVASPLYAKEGPRKTYMAINAVLDKVSPPINLSLTDFSAMSPKNEIVTGLHKIFRMAPKAIGSIRATRNAINGAYIEDAYIYRV